MKIQSRQLGQCSFRSKRKADTEIQGTRPGRPVTEVTGVRANGLCAFSAPIKKVRLSERGVFAIACQYIVSARSDRQPYCHRNVTSSPCWRTTKLCSTIACRYSALSAPRVAATSYCHPGCFAILFAYPLFKPVRNYPMSRICKSNVPVHVPSL